MYFRIYCVNLQGSIDWSSCRLFFYRIFQLNPCPYDVWGFMFCLLSIKGKTLAMFCCCFLCCVYESLARSRGVCLYTYLGFLISRLMLRAWWLFQMLHKEFKENTSGSICSCYESKKEVVRGLRSVTWSW